LGLTPKLFKTINPLNLIHYIELGYFQNPGYLTLLLTGVFCQFRQRNCVSVWSSWAISSHNDVLFRFPSVFVVFIYCVILQVVCILGYL